MNKKLITLSLVIGLGFSQMPLQAAFFPEAGISKAGASWFMNLVRENPIKSLAVVGGMAGLAYLAYKYKTAKHKEESSVQNSIVNVVKNKDQVKQEINSAFKAPVRDVVEGKKNSITIEYNGFIVNVSKFSKIFNVQIADTTYTKLDTLSVGITLKAEDDIEAIMKYITDKLPKLMQD